MRRLLVGLVVLLLLVAGGGAWWLHHPVSFDRARLAPGATSLDLSIEPGTTPRGVAQAVADAGVQIPPQALFLWFRLSGQARKIRAGSYEITPGATPRSILRMLVRGEETLRQVTLVDGWTFAQVRAALAKAEQLKPDTQGLTDDAIMALLGRPGVSPQGRFYPDTYNYAKGSSDLAVLRRAMRLMDTRLAAAWAGRAPGLPITTPDQALILASIVEKETGQAADRAMIAGVFCNRLRLGMPLQTDPTVIFGLGDKFDGTLHKRDLQTDTPWNTYTRVGLPPTPIAMPGDAALIAALHPATTKALYFVARGDGSSEFSTSLDEHNRAVNKYQKGHGE
ncbi:MAG: endolytic transglycosylase MltG [Burkholderiaceae bacterium]|nr:MAG: endolytic transglycosylase MltG [Burkholderiaceae bacterium]TBR74217.1 MAG: endolytic transglycosylase MltG [Burkholderiaceae bacterium]